MAEPGALLTPLQFSAGVGGKVAPGDPRLQPLIDGATRAIRRYCGWHIAPELSETNRFLDSNGGSLLVLPTQRLVSIDALAIHTNRHDLVEPWYELDAADLAGLEWSENGEVRRRWWPNRFRGVRASFTHGFEDAPDVSQIIQQVVANAISSPLGATREQAGALAVSWATTAPGVSGGLSLLERDLATLNSYRLPPRMGA